MVEQARTNFTKKNPMPGVPSKADIDEVVMSKIWKIIGRGNNAEVKQTKDSCFMLLFKKCGKEMSLCPDF